MMNPAGEQQTTGQCAMSAQRKGATMTTAVVEDKRVGKRINVTNVNAASHHLDQATKSLTRAFGILNAMTNGRDGRFAAKLVEGRDRLYIAEDAITDAGTEINSVLSDLNDLF